MLRFALLYLIAWWVAAAGGDATTATATTATTATTTTATACDAPGGGPEMAATAVGKWARTRIRFVTVATGSYVASAIYQARTIMALGGWRPCDILIVCTDRHCSNKLQSYHGGIIPSLLFDTSPHCRNQSDVDRLPRGLLVRSASRLLHGTVVVLLEVPRLMRPRLRGQVVRGGHRSGRTARHTVRRAAPRLHTACICPCAAASTRLHTTQASLPLPLRRCIHSSRARLRRLA